MIKFAHIDYLYLLGLLPFIIIIFWFGLYLRSKALKRFGNPNLIRHLMPEIGKFKTVVKFSLVFSTLAFIIFGLANPQIGKKMEEVKREGIDIMIAIDVSNSMRAEDFKPNRLEHAKKNISRLINRLQNDRIGLIVFGGESYLQLPLTTDYSAARLMLSAIDFDVVPIQGTAIGSSIRMALRSFVAGEKKHKVIVIITDGENHEDDAISAASEAFSDGVIIHTIGIGSPEGAPIPLYQNNVQIGFKKDSNGNIVITKLDEVGLQQIANAGGGKYIRGISGGDELDIILKEIQSMEKKEFGTKIFTEFEDIFQYFLGLAFILLTIEFFISERKNKFIAKWNIFKKPF